MNEMERCSCCGEEVPFYTTVTVGPKTVFCLLCRPPEDVLDDFDALVKLVDLLDDEWPPPCPHGFITG
jgi:hypothetical protein